MSHHLFYGFDDATVIANILREKVKANGWDPANLLDGVILGSGLGSFADTHLALQGENGQPDAVVIPYDDLYATIDRPLCKGKVAGHSKKVIIAPLKGDDSGRLIMALSGREHPYEGVSGQRATFLIRVMQMLQIRTMFCSNAAGIITPQTITPPALILTHSNKDFAISEDSPLIGYNDERFGPRFPDMMDMYPRETRELVKQAAADLNIDLLEGTYIRYKGPNYESPEEISEAVELLETIWRRGRERNGEDRFQGDPVGLVGMSSAYEARVIYHAKQSKTHAAFQDGVAFVSVATNYAGSVGPDGFVAALTHDEVQEKAFDAERAFGVLAKEVIVRMRG